MLHKNRRISRGEFPSGGKPAVFWRGTVLRAARTPAKKNSTFAVVVSKKYAKSAVARNKFRRRVYAAIATRLPAADADGAWKYVFTPAKNIAEIAVEDIKAEIDRIFKEQPQRPHSENA